MSRIKSTWINSRCDALLF